MKRSLPSTFVLAMILIAAKTAHADDTFVYAGVGQGAEIGVGKVINDSFSIRADIGRDAGGTYQRNLGANDYQIRPEANTRGNILLDWFPITGSGFRVTGGVAFANDQTFNSTALTDGSGNYRINGNAYSANAVGQLRAVSTFNKAAPEIGIGWDSAPANKPGWRLMTGVNLSLLTGGHTTLSSTAGAGNAGLASDIAAEQSAVNSDFGNRRGVLNFNLGVGYSF